MESRCDRLAVQLLVLCSLLALCARAKKSEEITCAFDLGQEPYASGQTLMLCVNYVPVMIKENTYLKVGKTTVLHQKYIWKIFKEINTDIVFQVANTSIYSMSIPFNRYKNGLTFPFIPLVITMDYGKVIDMRIEEINDVCTNDQVKTKIIKNFYSSSKAN